MSTKTFILIAILVLFTTLGSFYFGYILKNQLKNNEVTTESITQNNGYKPYFSDEIILVSKSDPRYTIIASASRLTKDNLIYTQRQKALFFDGLDWQINTEETTSTDIEIAKTSIIPNWKVTDDPSYVLKQKVTGQINLNDKVIYFDVPLIENELGIRSLAEYTIFRSEADGTITIDGQTHDCYVLYTRNYSYSAMINSIVVTNALGINTDWLAFWDDEGNFYNIDKTVVTDEYTGEYKSHSIAVIKDNKNKVQKTFTVNFIGDKTDNYDIELFDNKSILINSKLFNKTTKNPKTTSDYWLTGFAKGTVKLENGKIIKGFGIYERIYQ